MDDKRQTIVHLFVRASRCSSTVLIIWLPIFVASAKRGAKYDCMRSNFSR